MMALMMMMIIIDFDYLSMMNQSIDNQLQSNERTMSMISTLQQNPNNNDQQQSPNHKESEIKNEIISIVNNDDTDDENINNNDKHLPTHTSLSALNLKIFVVVVLFLNNKNMS